MPVSLRDLYAGTFSIVAYDAEAEEWGIAVQSKLLAIGALSPWAAAGVGAVVTQAFINPNYGPQGLKLLAEGNRAEQTVKRLVEADKLSFMRQIGVVDRHGNSATYTGRSCQPWAGGQTGPQYTVQGNLLAGPQVIKAMVHSYETSPGPLAERLLSVLEAGQKEGGDRRGQQSAALLVVKKNGGYAGLNDRYIDLRVDDHPAPIQELKRLYSLHRLSFPPL